MLKKILASVSAMALALGMIALVAGPASAHTGDLNVVAVCNTTTGNYDFTATLVISQTNETGATYWKVGTSTFAGTPTSAAGLPNGPVASTGATTITLTTFSLPGTTTGLGPWVYAFTTWTPDNYTKGSDGQLLKSLDGSCSKPVAPTAPTFTPAVCVGGSSGNGSYTIPSMTGVQYSVSTGGSYSNVSAGTYPVTPPKTVSVKAVAKSGSGVTLTGTTSWSYSYTTEGDCKATPATPTVTGQVCTIGGDGNGVYTSGYITIPATAHVQYSINGTIAAAGQHPLAPGTYTVTAVGIDGYSLTGYPTGGWSKTITSAVACGNVTPAAPSVTDQICTVNGDGNGVYTSGYITIPVSTKVNYFINGSAASAGQHNLVPGTYTVTEVVVPNYTLVGYPAGGWSETIHSALACDNVTPAAPSVTDQICTVNGDGNGVYTSGYITIPVSTKVNYFINGSAASAGQHDLGSGTYTVTAVAVPNYTLVGYPAGGWSETIHSALACGNVTPAAPSVTDQICTVNGDGNGVYTSGYITIPVSTKVNYFINGSAASAGQHDLGSGTYTVTAVAVPNYTLTGYPAGGWSETIHSALACGNVTPAAPSVTDQVCNVNSDGNGVYTGGYITIPASTEVNYFIDGSPAASGVHSLAPGTYTVTAVAVPNYTLTGYPAGGWSETIHSALACGNVTPAAPSVTDQVCTVNSDGNGEFTSGYITIPSSTNVSYFIDGAPASAGQHDLGSGTYTVTAVALADYTLTGYPDGGWSETIHDALACGDVTPTPPSVTDETCSVNTDGKGAYTSGSITIPASTTVNYFVDGAPVTAGAHDYPSGTHVVTAVAVPDYTLVGYPTDGWSETIGAASPCGNVSPVDPIVVDQSCVVSDSGTGSYVSGYIDLPASGTVEYFIDGSPAGTHNVLAPGTYQVTASAVPNYTLVGYPVGGWSETIHTALACGNLVDHPLVTPIVTSVQLSCTKDGSYTLSNDLAAPDGVLWTVDGSPVLQGTYVVTSAKTVHVHADPNGPAFGFADKTQQDWTLVFAAATTCDLKTLALTGTQPVGGMLLAYFMLLAGLGIVTVRAVRRHGRPQE